MGKYLSEDLVWEDESGYEWTPQTFAQKSEWEGDLLAYGGPGIFPPSVREAAQIMEDFYSELEEYGEEE
jgi:hypothetical protein